MALTLHQTIFINKNRTPNSSHLSISQTHFSKLSKFQYKSKTHFPNHLIFTPKSINLLPIVKVNNASVQEPYGTSPDQVNSTGFNFDAFLSIAEFLSLASSVAVSIYAAVSVSCGGGGLVGGKILVWQCVVLGSSVVVGAFIRRRQWRRICGVRVSRSSSSFYGANLLERVEKLEENLRSSATVIRVMSRQLEKLGIRFRVTRKALKEPIAEAAALAQKNSEATRALAAQEDILEKELGEIQKVLMAMQEQQQKQLELILAIGKAGKLWDTKPAQNKDENSLKTSKSSVDGVKNLEINQIENRKLQTESNNDRP